jgi:hypothetical protein
MSDKFVVIGTWTNADQTKEWDVLAGPLNRIDADIALDTIRENIPTDAPWLEHQEFVVSLEVYKLMLEEDEIDRTVKFN